jgi:microcystin-dependent protein
MSLNDDQITARNFKQFYDKIFPYLGGNAKYGFTPVGTIIAVMGNTPPANYLVCDGSEVRISQYPVLADYFYTQFGSSNHFGGDGRYTFAVPDLRGEFLRGSGENTHDLQGSGGEVGEHQDSTGIPYYFSKSNGEGGLYFDGTAEYSGSVTNTDSITTTTHTFRLWSTASHYNASDLPARYSIRPTNTSVLFCIATTNIFIQPDLQYSELEQVVGTWIDGKPLYQKTFEIASTVAGENTISTQGLNIDHVLSIRGTIYGSNDDNEFDYQINSSLITGAEQNISWYRKTAQQVVIHIYSNTMSQVGRRAFVTIQYTKTTD